MLCDYYKLPNKKLVLFYIGLDSIIILYFSRSINQDLTVGALIKEYKKARSVDVFEIYHVDIEHCHVLRKKEQSSCKSHFGMSPIILYIASYFRPSEHLQLNYFTKNRNGRSTRTPDKTTYYILIANTIVYLANKQ